MAALMAMTSLAMASVAMAGGAKSDRAAQHIADLAANAIVVLEKQDLTLEQREDEFRVILQKGFNLKFIGRFVAGRSWRKMSSGQQQEYSALFSEYVLKSYASQLGGYAGEKFEVNSARAVGKKDVLVKSKIVRPSGPPIKTDWRLREFDGDPRIIDLMIEGISMAVTLRQEFGSVIRKKGVEGLLDRLRMKAEKMMAQSS